MSFVWLGAAIALGLFEAAAPGLVCIWFCLGAAITFLVSLFVENLLIQVIVFVVASLVMLLSLRPFMKRRVNANGEQALTNSDAYVGRTVVVTQAIPQGSRGRVRLADVSWVARTQDGQALPSGSRAIVRAVEGTVLVVEAVS